MTALRYRALRKIAEGGSAEVYLGEQLGAGFTRPVVLKRIRAELTADVRYREIILEEAQLAMSLHHSNLVEVLDLGVAEGRSYLVLELVDGWTLQDVLRRARAAGLALPPGLAVYIAAEVCRALAYAHERAEGGVPLGIVHRDVCPNNVLLSTQAEVKLIDFGIARARTRPAHTGTGRTKGKPAWMSPEQARAEQLDARSDLYSVGSLLFAMLTDVPPYQATDELEVISRVSRGAAGFAALARREVCVPLRELVRKAMAERREARFQSAQGLLLALEELGQGGRSELEDFLHTLSALDGDLGITRQRVFTSPSAPEGLSKESSSVTLALGAPRSPWRWAKAAAALATVAVLFLPGSPVPGPAVDAPVTPAASPAPAVERAAAPIEWTEWDDFPQPLPVLHPAEKPVAQPVRISARLASRQKKAGAVVAVVLESRPAGAVIRVGQRELGRTPATLHLKKGRAYELSFEAKGSAPVRKRLLLTARRGKAPKLSLRAR